MVSTQHAESTGRRISEKQSSKSMSASKEAGRPYWVELRLSTIKPLSRSDATVADPAT